MTMELAADRRKAGETIGVYCGSFDPIHTGHAMVANYVSQWGNVDEVWLMVSRLNPLKEGKKPADDHHRMAMARLVAEGCRKVTASEFEMHLPLPSYTYFTLCRLREKYPGHKFKLIIGSDNWIEFQRWRDSEKIIREFGLIIYPRPGYDVSDLPDDGVVLLDDGPTSFISSTFIRNAVAAGKDINYFVPSPVASYIKEHRLYTT